MAFTLISQEIYSHLIDEMHLYYITWNYSFHRLIKVALVQKIVNIVYEDFI